MILPERKENGEDLLVLWVSDKRIKVQHDDGEIELQLPGKWRLDSQGSRPVAPGDLVRVSGRDPDMRLIEVLPRRNEFTRREAGLRPMPQVAAVNLDQVLIIAAAAQPPTPFGLIDRLLVTASLGRTPANLIINKCDLISPERKDLYLKTYKDAEIDLSFVSALTGEGMDLIVAQMQGKITLLAGASGVGKSSITNRIDPLLTLKTGGLSTSTGKGRHITSSARLYPLPRGGWVIDTPGLRECSPWGMTKSNLPLAFPEIRLLNDQCRFRNCLHLGEAGCVVSEAVVEGRIPQSRYDCFQKLMLESGASNRMPSQR